MPQSLNRPVTQCCCTLAVPHRHPSGEHWCDRCGGYLGKPGNFDGPASSHEAEGCKCPPCCAPLCGEKNQVPGARDQVPGKNNPTPGT